MCGITGYIGYREAYPIVIKGLQRLEYRGYDSAGVAIFHRGEVKRIRSEGKLNNLEGKLENEEFDGHLGIGHTRWATHGAPSERNAHPHTAQGVSIVHNGIIENYSDLRDELAEECTFESDTDSELVAHLISLQMKTGENLFKSVLNIIHKLEGAYSILAVSKDSPEEIVAFKNGPPLVLGKVEGKKQSVIMGCILLLAVQ